MGNVLAVEQGAPAQVGELRLSRGFPLGLARQCNPLQIPVRITAFRPTKWNRPSAARRLRKEDATQDSDAQTRLKVFRESVLIPRLAHNEGPERHRFKPATLKKFIAGFTDRQALASTQTVEFLDPVT
jgi:hypothetical protein